MGPLRLAIIVLLIYIIYRLLTRRGRPGSESRRVGQTTGDQVQDVLVEDPVCHTLVPKGQAIRLYHEQRMYHFCSQQCCDKFLGEQGEEQ